MTRYMVLVAVGAIGVVVAALRGWFIPAAILFAIVAAALVLLVLVGGSQRRHTREEAASLIERYLASGDAEVDWDGLTCVRAAERAVEAARCRCVEIEEEHSSPDHPPAFIDPHGVELLRELIAELRGPAT